MHRRGEDGPLKGDRPTIMVTLRTSRKATEALRLEIRRLAGRLGLPAAAVEIRPVGDGAAKRVPLTSDEGGRGR